MVHIQTPEFIPAISANPNLMSAIGTDHYRMIAKRSHPGFSAATLPESYPIENKRHPVEIISGLEGNRTNFGL